MIPGIVGAFQTDIGMRPEPFIESLGLFSEHTGAGFFKYSFESGRMFYINRAKKKQKNMLKKRGTASYARATASLL